MSATRFLLTALSVLLVATSCDQDDAPLGPDNFDPNAAAAAAATITPDDMYQLIAHLASETTSIPMPRQRRRPRSRLTTCTS
jgi:hypothetical protein